jgi:hypothetical protein
MPDQPTTAAPAAQIILERDEYFLLRDVLGAAGRLFNQVGPHDAEQWARWNRVLDKVIHAHRYEGASDGT